MKRCSTTLIIRKMMQIKATMKYYLTCIRIAIIKKTNKYWQECGEKGTLVHCWWECKLECKLVQPLWKTAWSFLKILKIELPYDLAIPPLGIYPKESKSGSCRNNRTPPCSLTCYLPWPRYGNNLNVHQQVNE